MEGEASTLGVLLSTRRSKVSRFEDTKKGRRYNEWMDGSIFPLLLSSSSSSFRLVFERRCKVSKSLLKFGQTIFPKQRYSHRGYYYFGEERRGVRLVNESGETRENAVLNWQDRGQDSRYVNTAYPSLTRREEWRLNVDRRSTDDD